MIILIIHIIVSYDQNISLIFMWKMGPMSGFDIRLVFTLPPRDSTLQWIAHFLCKINNEEIIRKKHYSSHYKNDGIDPPHFWPEKGFKATLPSSKVNSLIYFKEKSLWDEYSEAISYSFSHKNVFFPNVTLSLMFGCRRLYQYIEDNFNILVWIVKKLFWNYKFASNKREAF